LYELLKSQNPNQIKIEEVSKAANDSESTTMIRMNELHVKTGRARQQQYSGK
jgi:hypothetical protein